LPRTAGGHDPDKRLPVFLEQGPAVESLKKQRLVDEAEAPKGVDALKVDIE